MLLSAGLVLALGVEFLQVTRTVPELAAPDEQATRVLIEKAARQLTLERDGRVLARYAVALGSDPVGDKVKEGAAGPRKASTTSISSTHAAAITSRFASPTPIVWIVRTPGVLVLPRAATS